MPDAKDATVRSLWAESAGDYAEVALRLPSYVETNRALIDAIDLRAGHSLLDLACGTGATLDAAFRHEPGLAGAWAIDWVEEMTSRIDPGDRPIRTGVAPAQRFTHLLGGEKVDRVVCNGAFFQFEDPERVLEEVASVLAPGGRFGFTLPGPSNTVHFIALFHELGITRPLPQNRRASTDDLEGRCTMDNLARILAAARWELLGLDSITVRSSKEEYVRWLALPVFRRPEWLGRDRRELEEELLGALEHTEVEPALSWLVAVARPESA